MAHSLTPTLPPIAKSNKKIITSYIPCVAVQRVWASHHPSTHVLDHKLVHRRTVTLRLAGAVVGLNIVGDGSANAARRPPPPPAGEKKDPNVSGVQAKVLASKKRKEAMKQAVAKMREKGKAVDGPSPSE